MASKDTYHVTQVFNAFTILNMTGTQEAFGSAIDTYQMESLQFIGLVDELTAGTYSITLQEDDDSGFSAPQNVGDNFVFNSPMVFTNVDPYGTDHMAYVGHKRYVRVRVNSDSVNVEASICVSAIVGKAWHNPTEGDVEPTG